MHKTSLANMSRFVSKHLQDKQSEPLDILDIGSQDVGRGSYKPLFENKGWNYVGLDITEGDNVSVVVKDIYNWKELKTQSFNVVISGQALEHVEYVWVTMFEIARVLKKGGLCCIVVPSSGPEHRFPLDCYRFFPDGIKALAAFVGLEIVESYNCWHLAAENAQDNQWKDTVLIGRKKSNPTLADSVKFFLKFHLSKITAKLNLVGNTSI